MWLTSNPLWHQLREKFGAGKFVVQLFQCRHLVVGTDEHSVKMWRVTAHADAAIFLRDARQRANPISWLFDATDHLLFHHFIKLCLYFVLQCDHVVDQCGLVRVGPSPACASSATRRFDQIAVGIGELNHQCC